MSNRIQIFTQQNFIEAFQEMALSVRIDELKAELELLTKEQFKDLAEPQYLSDSDASLNVFYDHFLPKLTQAINEGFEQTALFFSEDAEDAEDCIEFLAESAHTLFTETGAAIEAEIESLFELFNAYNSLCGDAGTSEFTAIAEDDFEDYIRETALDLGLLDKSMENYVDWEKYASDNEQDYKSYDLEAPESLNFSGSVYVRA